jgi:DNA repair protein RadC
MTDQCALSPESTPARNVQRAVRRRRGPIERGADLLQPASRLSPQEATVLAQARGILLRLSARRSPAAALSSPELVREYLRTLLAGQERELFVMVVLDNRHRVVASEILFAGTIDGARVYPREVVKCALRYNAAAVIFAHDHPSGVLEPSSADEHITRHLKEALALIDVRVLDHFVIGDGGYYSFSERGLL